MRLDGECRFTVYVDGAPIGEVGSDFLSVTQVDQLLPAQLELKGDSPLTESFLRCRDLRVTVVAERAGDSARYNVSKFDYSFVKGEWIGCAYLVPEPEYKDGYPTEQRNFPVADTDDSFHGVDIEMWNAGKAEGSRVVRPCRLRINGVEVPIVDGAQPYMHVGDIGGKKFPLVVDIKGIVVRSLNIHPTDPQKRVEIGDGKAEEKPAPNLLKSFLPTAGSELASNSWLTRIGGSLAGSAPGMVNIPAVVQPQRRWWQFWKRGN